MSIAVLPRARHRSAPLLLLAGSGLALAVVVALAKRAAALGLTPLDFAALSGALAASGLALVLRRERRSRSGLVDGRWAVQAAVLGVVSYAVPNIAQAWVAAHVGAGYAAMMLALTPLITLALALLLGTEPLRLGVVAGLMLGLAGVWCLVLPRWQWQGGSAGALLAGLIAPLANAAGNLLRARLLRDTARSPLDNACMVLSTAALCLVPLALSQGLLARITPHGVGLVLAAGVVMAVFNVLLFRLQGCAGAVRLSQVGYVAGLFGVALSALFLGEPLRWEMVLAAALIIAGVRQVERQR